MDESQRHDLEPTQAPEPKPRHRLLLGLTEYLELLVGCLCAILLLFAFAFRVCVVSGTSMMPTLGDGQILITSSLFYEPKTGDVVVFHQTSDRVVRYNEPMIKRVIATGGQHVLIDFENKTVCVDGVLLGEDYIQLIYNGQYSLLADHHVSYVTDESGNWHTVFEATVPEGHLFVMGDNRNNSADSRTSEIGFVDERRLLGHVIWRITPWELFGPLS